MCKLISKNFVYELIHEIRRLFIKPYYRLSPKDKSINIFKDSNLDKFSGISQKSIYNHISSKIESSYGFVPSLEQIEQLWKEGNSLRLFLFDLEDSIRKAVLTESYELGGSHNMVKSPEVQHLIDCFAVKQRRI